MTQAQAAEAFRLACAGQLPGFTVNGAGFRVKRPMARVAMHVTPAETFGEMLSFFDACVDDADALVDLILDPEGGLEIAEVREVFHHVVALTAGLPHWVAEALIAIASAEWLRLSGDLARSGCAEPLSLPFEVFLATVYSWVIRNGSPEGIEAFDKALFAPPAGTASEVIAALPEWQAEAMGDLFMAQLAARGDNPRTSG